MAGGRGGGSGGPATGTGVVLDTAPNARLLAAVGSWQAAQMSGRLQLLPGLHQV